MVFFLSDVSNADFNKNLKTYVKNELQNPESYNKSSTLSFNPINTLKSKLKTTGTVAGIGATKYVYDNKLNRRQKVQINKWNNLLQPPVAKPKKQWFSNPFRKKPLTTPTQPNGAIK